MLVFVVVFLLQNNGLSIKSILTSAMLTNWAEAVVARVLAKLEARDAALISDKQVKETLRLRIFRYISIHNLPGIAFSYFIF